MGGLCGPSLKKLKAQKPQIILHNLQLSDPISEYPIGIHLRLVKYHCYIFNLQREIMDVLKSCLRSCCGRDDEASSWLNKSDRDSISLSRSSVATLSDSGGTSSVDTRPSRSVQGGSVGNVSGSQPPLPFRSATNGGNIFGNNEVTDGKDASGFVGFDVFEEWEELIKEYEGKCSCVMQCSVMKCNIMQCSVM